MKPQGNKVSLVTDIDAVAKELVPQPMWMIRPTMKRKYLHQRVPMTAEVVDLSTLNLAKMKTFEIL
ncbi:MAG TPA: hypothetical protein VHV83_01040 [Armatimonadota bacterium]|nr:hypothetical protein [Armatimonadota bacterium]